MIHAGIRHWPAEPALEAMWSLEGFSREAAAILEPYQGRRRFRLISLPDMDAGELERLDGIAALLFRLARTRTLKDAQAAAVPFMERLMSPEFAMLRKPVMEWLQLVFLPTMGIRDARLQHMAFEEFFAMSDGLFEGWKEEYRAEGEARGVEKGRWAEKLENALGLLRENVSVETISRGLGLSIEKVREPAAGLGKA